MNTLDHLGWTPTLQSHFLTLSDPTLVPGRVARIDRGRAEVLGLDTPTFATLAGRFRLEEDELAQPTTGDWVACRRTHDTLVIEAVLPRHSCFVRKAAGRRARPQLVAANIDRILILTAAGGDFSPARVERYLTAALAGGAEAIVVLSKADLSPDPEVERRLLSSVAARAPVVCLSTLGEAGVAELAPFLEPGKTLALVGSSGVGKSTLANRLLGTEHFGTASVRESDETGRHKTTHRELVLAPGGYLLIDTPGMREFGLWDAAEGLDDAFADVTSLAGQCRFRDCSHTTEPGCAVNHALESGELPAERYEHYRALDTELTENESKRKSRARKEEWMEQIATASRQRRKLHRKLGLKAD